MSVVYLDCFKVLFFVCTAVRVSVFKWTVVSANLAFLTQRT